MRVQSSAQPPVNPITGSSMSVQSLGLREQIAKLEKDLRDANGMERLYEEQSQQDLAKIKDLEHRLTNLTIQLELLSSKQARFIRVEQILIDLGSREKDRDFAEELKILGTGFSLSALVTQIVAGNSENAWNSINAFRSRLKDASTRVQTLIERLEVEIPAPVVSQAALPIPATSDLQIAKLIDVANEDRVRAISRDLYERSLALPRHITTLYDHFVSNRTRFQQLSCERDEIMEDLIQRRIDAQLTPARAVVERALPLMEVGALQTLTQLIQYGRVAECRLTEIEAKLISLKDSFNTIRNDYHELSSSAADIRVRAEEAKRAAALFGLPCPAEIALQFNETIQRLLFVDMDTERGQRLQVMRTFQPLIKDRVKVIKDFMANLLSAEAFLFSVNKVSPEQLFLDNPDTEEALKRLFILTGDIANASNSERARTKTTLISILQKSGLVQGDEDHLKTIADAQKDFFEAQKVQFYYVWKPKDSCRSSAARFKSLLKSPEAVLEALRLGQRKHYEAKYAGKGKAAATTQD